MKILFVCSGNSTFGISPIIFNQGESLKKEGIEIDYFTIRGRGIKGYLKNIIPLKEKITQNNYDLVHAHYSLSAFIASLAINNEPLVVSLMGSDVKSSNSFKFVIRLFDKLYWSRTIVKSVDMKNSINLENVNVIPNGVDFNVFMPTNKIESRKKLNWDLSKKYILFAANPQRKEKNYLLAQQSYQQIKDSKVKLKTLNDIPNSQVPIHINASDVVLLTSLWEGSPNVIKEAMACNIPVVSTNVGDVREVIGNTEGCYITSFDPEDVANKINKALAFGKRTTGRNDIKHLDSGIIAKKLINVYHEVLKNKI